MPQRAGDRIDAHRRRRRAAAWLPVLVVAAGLLAYANCFDGAFLLDDWKHIVLKPMPVTPLVEGERRPVAAFTFAVNRAVGGLDVRGFHAVNLAVHLLAALLLFDVVRRTAHRGGRRAARAAPWIAGAVALLWVVHPLTTSAVTYMVQRYESLMAMFYLLTLACFIRGVEASRERRRGGAPRMPALLWHALAVVACVLGLGSKSVMITAPVAVLLWDRTFAAGTFRVALRRRAVIHVLLLATLAVLLLTGVAQGVLDSRPRRGANVGLGMVGLEPGEYAATQPGVILHYLRLVLWPHPLTLDPAWPIAGSIRDILPAAAIVLGLIAAAAIATVRRAPLGFAALFVFLVLAPTSSVIPIRDPAFEHRMYLPLAGALTVIVGGAWMLGRRWIGAGARLPAAAAALLVVGAALGVGTHLRNRDYHDPLRMWRSVLRQAPHNPRAHHELGNALRAAGSFDEGIRAHRRAAQLAPENAGMQASLGNALFDAGRHAEAAAAYDAALAAGADWRDVHFDRGRALARSGRLDEAAQALAGVHRRWPDDLEALIELACIEADRGRLDRAIELFEVVIAQDPGASLAHLYRGHALLRLGRRDAAIDAYRAALRADPASEAARAVLEALESSGGSTENDPP